MIYLSYMGAIMESFIIPIVIIAMIYGVVSALLDGPGKKRKGSGKKPRKQQGRSDARDYVPAGPLLSPAELNFYRLLCKVVKNPNDPGAEVQAIVMAKVRVWDLVKVRKGLSHSARHAAQNRIRAKHADFVLCDPASLRPFCVIELDDRSHRSEKARRRDALVDSIYAAVGLPILHVDCRRGYSMQEVGGMIREAVGRGV